MRPGVLITATGTDAGKTHVLEAIVRALPPVPNGFVVWKPVESGGGPSWDSDRLADAIASRHTADGVAQPPAQRFAAPLAPPFAARLEGKTVSRETFEAPPNPWLVELAGGLYAPTAEGALGIDLALALRPTWTVLVAPNRLGVLHDILSTRRAAAADGLMLADLALVDQPAVDFASAHNEAALAELAPDLRVYRVARGTPAALALTESVRSLAARAHAALVRPHDPADLTPRP